MASQHFRDGIESFTWRSGPAEPGPAHSPDHQPHVVHGALSSAPASCLLLGPHSPFFPLVTCSVLIQAALPASAPNDTWAGGSSAHL